MKKLNNSNDNKSIKRTIEIVIIIILLLLLTCCTSKYYGKIGSLFHNSSNHNITDDVNNKKIITSDDFILDTNEANMFIHDDDLKISYSYKNINPKNVTCSTDDASIATCYIDKSYVVIKPKKVGSTNVFIYTDVNGVTYKAKALINIKKGERGIFLPEVKGTINLAYNSTKTLPININGINGVIKVDSSNKDVATAIIRNNKLLITAKTNGNALITVFVDDNDKKYEATYKLSVIAEKKNHTPVNTTKKTTVTTKPITTTIVTTKPIIPPKPTEVIKSNNSKLNNISISNGILSPSFNSNIFNYSVSVNDEVEKTSINITKGDNKQILEYYYKGVNVLNLNDLALDYNSNVVTIVVTAEDGSKSTYKININRSKSNNCNLNSLTTSKGTITPNFDSNITGYVINVDNNDETTTLNVTSAKKTTVKYTYKGKTVTSLKNLALDYGNNIVDIEVTAQDGSKKTYVVTIVRPKDTNNNLSNLSISSGALNPTFNKDTTSYNVEVENNISSVNLSAIKESTKSTIKYYYNSIEISSLNNINLDFNTNKIDIVVTSQEGVSKTYFVNITRKLSDNNKLGSLSINGYSLNPTFNKDVNEYSIVTKYNIDNVTLSATKENEYSSIKYYVNNTEITNSNIPINVGDNYITVRVTAQNGSTNDYIINVHRVERTIEFVGNDFKINMDIAVLPYQLAYKVLDDSVEVSDFNLSDINITTSVIFNGSIEHTEKNIIKLTPINSDIGKTLEITLKCNNKETSANIKIITNEYFINSYKDSYDLIYKDGSGVKNLIINNNILDGTLTESIIPGGIRIKKDDNHYVDIISSNPSVIKVAYDSGSTSLSISAIANMDNGNANITIKGYTYGTQIGNTINISLTIKARYKFIIDANGGLFYEKNGDEYSGGITSNYEYILDKDSVINLANYIGLKKNNDANCEYYTQIGFNTNNLATTKEYDNDSIITISNDITLYSIYESTSAYLDVLKAGTVYLSELDIFRNDDYYEKYGIDKVIYPGAKGSHVMTINNTGTGVLKINKIRLQEDTVCISQKNCINMGYVIKKYVEGESDIYFLGGSNNYDVINKSASYQSSLMNLGVLEPYQTTKEIDTTTKFIINPGESAELSIIWKWVELDDNLDTTIASNSDTIDYYLTISFDYEREETNCSLTP